jgi:hypothetical protein
MRRAKRTIILGVLPCVVVAGACSPSNPTTDSGAAPAGDSGLPPAAGGTGAFGIVTVGGKQKMYLPQNATFDFDSGTEVGLIAVVDVSKAAAPAPSDGGSAATPALITTIELPSPGSEAGSFDPQYATATGGDASVVVAVSSAFPTVWFIDPNTDRVTGTLSLGATYGTSSFSGGGGYVTGVAVDSAHGRAVLSVWNGYVLIDLATRTVASTILAPPAENFGYDSLTQRIYSPFYGCNDAQGPSGESAPSCGDPKGPDGITVMSDGLQVIDLADPDQTVYTYENTDPDSSGLNATPNQPVGSEPDSAAVDPTTGIVVVPSEGDTFQSIIDMSKAVFDKTSKTVTAPRRIIDTSAVSGLDAVAIEPTSHIALFEAEFDTQVAAADLTLSSEGNASWAYSDMPLLPDGNTFENLGDPHGLAVTTALVGGTPVGFVVDGSLRWVGRIEFARIAAQASDDAGVSLDPAGLGAPDAGVGLNGIGPFVTYLDVTTPE